MSHSKDFKIPQAQPPKKKVKSEDRSEPVPFKTPTPDVMLNEAEPELDAKSLYSLHNQLEQAIEINRELRLKYADEPQRFFDSEAALNQLLAKFSDIGAYPELVPIYTKHNILKSLARLLDHQNDDIVAQAAQAICEFVTIDLEEAEDFVFQNHMKYCISFAAKDFGKTVVTALKKLDEQQIQQYEVAYKLLRILQQLLDFSPSFADILVDESPLMGYLADRIMPNFQIQWRPIDDNKYISSQILVQLLQNSPQNRFTFRKYEGVAVLIQSIAVYCPGSGSRGLPDNEDEKEYLNNLFNLLCILLADDDDSKRSFNSNNGVALMTGFIKSKAAGYAPKALKCLSFGFMAQSCSTFVDSQGGLKYIFPILMRQGLKEKDADDQKAVDENCLRIIKSLVMYCEGMCLDRVINKFKEKNFEKLLRLVQLRVEYSDLVGDDEEGSEQEKDDDYLVKLGLGLTVIELVDFIMLSLSLKDKQVSYPAFLIFYLLNLGAYAQLRMNLKEMMKHFRVPGNRIKRVLQRYYNELVQENEERPVLQRLLDNVLPYFLIQEQP